MASELNESSAATLLLTPAERERFATWLETDAEIDEGMAARLRDLPSMASMGNAMADERAKDAAAKRRIAAQLRSIEDVTV